MIIRIATKAWDQSSAAWSRDTTRVGLRTAWVELDGQRTDSVVASKVETDKGVTMVTLTFMAAAEMVLLDSNGEIIPQEIVGG